MAAGLGSPAIYLKKNCYQHVSGIPIVGTKASWRKKDDCITCHGRPNVTGFVDHGIVSSICLQEAYGGDGDAKSLHSAIE